MFERLAALAATFVCVGVVHVAVDRVAGAAELPEAQERQMDDRRAGKGRAGERPVADPSPQEVEGRQLAEPEAGERQTREQIVEEKRDRTRGAGRRWFYTGLVAAGLHPFDGGQVADPTFGFGFGQRISDNVELETQVLGVAGLVQEREPRTFRDERRQSTHESWERRRSIAVASRLNYLVGDARVRPYFTIGAGVGWGRAEGESSSSVAEPPGAPPEVFRRRFSRQGIGIVSMLGTGVDIEVAERWRLRPEALLPFLWGGVWSANITMGVGLTYAPGGTGDARHPRDEGQRPAAVERRERPEPRRVAAPRLETPPIAVSGEGWDRVKSLGLGGTLRVRLESGLRLFSDQGSLESPGSRNLLGYFVEANDRELILQVVQGAPEGRWRISRPGIERVELGRIERDSPWEGVLAGFAIGAGIGAIGYLGGGEDHEVWLPAGAALIGAPLALVGGLTDHFHHTFRRTLLVYEARR